MTLRTIVYSNNHILELTQYLSQLRLDGQQPEEIGLIEEYSKALGFLLERYELEC